MTAAPAGAVSRPPPAGPRADARQRASGPGRLPARRWLGVLAVLGAALVGARSFAVGGDAGAAHQDAVLAVTDRTAAAGSRASTQAHLDDLTGQLERTRADLAGVSATTRDHQDTRNQVDASVAALTHELAGLEADRLAGEQLGVLQRERARVLRSCLTTLAEARHLITTGRVVEATDALRVGGEDCRRAGAAGDGTGPTADFAYDFPDPYVLVEEDATYAYATNGPAGSVQVLRSTGLTGWTLVGEALTALPPWARPGSTWAPAVLRVGSSLILYYAVNERSSDHQCISVAVAPHPQGPFADTSSGPLICQHDLGGSIDPSPVRAPDGSLYLLWKSDGDVSHLWAQRLAPAGTALEGEPSLLLSADQRWEGGIIEAPTMTQAGPYWLLLYAGNRWDTARYATGQAFCAGPLGPCRKGPNPVVVAGDDLAGPGGAELFRDRSGGLHIAFHAWTPTAIGDGNPRRLHIADVAVTPGGQLTVTR